MPSTPLENHDRLERLAKIAASALIVGGVAVKIWRSGEDSAYAHLSDKAKILFVGMVRGGMQKLTQFTSEIVPDSDGMESSITPKIRVDASDITETEIGELEALILPSQE